MKSRTNCKIIASRSHREVPSSQKQTATGFLPRLSLVPPTPAGVGGVRKRESCYNVNCELSGEAHCRASCCALGVPPAQASFDCSSATDSEAAAPAADTQAASSARYVLRDAVSCVQPLNVPPRKVVNLAALLEVITAVARPRPHLFLTCAVGGDAAVGTAVATWTGA